MNRLLGAFGRAAEDLEFYEAVFERLVAIEVVAEAELKRLAERRALDVERYMERAGVDPVRIEFGDACAVMGARGPAVAAALELAPIVRAPA